MLKFCQQTPHHEDRLLYLVFKWSPKNTEFLLKKKITGGYNVPHRLFVCSVIPMKRVFSLMNLNIARLVCLKFGTWELQPLGFMIFIFSLNFKEKAKI